VGTPRKRNTAGAMGMEPGWGKSLSKRHGIAEIISTLHSASEPQD
jgi:hypothetical protein